MDLGSRRLNETGPVTQAIGSVPDFSKYSGSSKLGTGRILFEAPSLAQEVVEEGTHCWSAFGVEAVRGQLWKRLPPLLL